MLGCHSERLRAHSLRTRDLSREDVIVGLSVVLPGSFLGAPVRMGILVSGSCAQVIGLEEDIGRVMFPSFHIVSKPENYGPPPVCRSVARSQGSFPFRQNVGIGARQIVFFVFSATAGTSRPSLRSAPPSSLSLLRLPLRVDRGRDTVSLSTSIRCNSNRKPKSCRESGV